MKHLLLICTLLLSYPVSAEPAPDWQLPALDGDTQVSLEQLRGQIVVLDFWASWCVPCRPAMAALSQLQQDYAKHPVRIVPISVDEDAQDARGFIQRYGPSLNSLLDSQGRVAEAYDLLGMPTSFVISPDGRIALRHEGFRKGDEQQWRQAIDALLREFEEPPPAPA